MRAQAMPARQQTARRRHHGAGPPPYPPSFKRHSPRQRRNLRVLQSLKGAQDKDPARRREEAREVMVAATPLRAQAGGVRGGRHDTAQIVSGSVRSGVRSAPLFRQQQENARRSRQPSCRLLPFFRVRPPAPKCAAAPAYARRRRSRRASSFAHA